ncbi:hypothetical protein B7P43_G14653 [Cryptotermes secundus]|uniref:DDE Tnp4 domain-containing protein n=1 Tax=Cryptotermes secundus TaxID=105785 RepID=A0A2J7RM70_9NEOP|nr:hypothetical protein B7P43_G14653 [Cryptotermes secundus]
MDKSGVLRLLMLEEEEDDEILHLILSENGGSRSVHDLFKARAEEELNSILINRHLMKGERKFREFFRLNIQQFNYVLKLVEDKIRCQSCNRVRHPITPAQKLAVTLRFMATRESFRSLEFAFHISQSYISRIVKQVLKILCRKLPPILMPPPNEDVLQEKTKEFWKQWNFPNCSLFYNYKDFFSTVLLAFVDANYKSTVVDIGSFGKEGDSGSLEKSATGKMLKSENFFPPPSALPNSDIITPYVMVCDDAFRLGEHMMKAYDAEKAIFNYRLSQASRISENSFGLLSQVLGVFYTPLAINPETSQML